MTSWAVLDSSILLATVLPERFSQEAIALITSLTGGKYKQRWDRYWRSQFRR